MCVIHTSKNTLERYQYFTVTFPPRIWEISDFLSFLKNALISFRSFLQGLTFFYMPRQVQKDVS